MTLLQRDAEEVVEARVLEGIEIHDVGIHQTDEGSHHLADGDPHRLVLLGRFADYGSGVDRIAATGHPLDVEHGELGGLGVMAEVIAEGAFHPAFARFHVALEDEFGVGRNQQLVGLGSNQLSRFAAEETGETQLVEVLGQRKDRGQHQDGIAAQDDCSR